MDSVANPLPPVLSMLMSINPSLVPKSVNDPQNRPDFMRKGQRDNKNLIRCENDRGGKTLAFRTLFKPKK
jgi:hypothetical protein